MSTINFQQAFDSYESNRQKSVEKFKHYKDEIERSDFSMLDFRDVAYYAKTLTEHDPTGKEWTRNDVRRLNQISELSHTPDAYSYLNSFVDSDTDDVLDFY